jgi:hypothetical protein
LKQLNDQIWPYLLHHLEEETIQRFIKEGNVDLLEQIINSLPADQNFSFRLLSFDEGLRIIVNTINKVFNEKEKLSQEGSKIYDLNFKMISFLIRTNIISGSN